MTTVDIRRPDNTAKSAHPPRTGARRVPGASRVVAPLVWLASLAGVAAGVSAAVHLLLLAEVLGATSATCLLGVAAVEAVTGHSGPLTLRRANARTPEGDVS